jgi:TolC family type I secretion outer membrane protein
MLFGLSKNYLVVIAAALLAFGGFGRSREASGLTLQEAYRLALENYETVKIARESFTQSELQKRKALSALLPSLTTELNYIRRPEAIRNSSGNVIRPQSNETFQLILNQPLFTGGQATSAYKIAGLGIEGSREVLGSTKEDLLFQVATTFYDALKAKKNVRIEEDNVKRLEEHKRDADARYRVGEVTKDILLRAQAELSGAKAELIRINTLLQFAKDRLALLTKAPDDFDVDEPASPLLPSQTDQEQLETAYRLRHDLVKKRFDEQIALESVRFARGGFYPFISLEAQFIQEDQSPASPFSSVTTDKFAMLKLSWPLFEGGFTMADVKDAKSRAKQAQLDRYLLKGQISLEVRRANLELHAFNSALVNLKDQMASADESYTIISKKFQFGLATNLDVLDANNALLDAERQLTNSLYDKDLAVLRLQKGMGVFLQYTGVE